MAPGQLCCLLLGDGLEQCPNPATHRIDTPNLPYSDTYACEDHIAALSMDGDVVTKMED